MNKEKKNRNEARTDEYDPRPQRPEARKLYAYPVLIEERNGRGQIKKLGPYRSGDCIKAAAGGAVGAFRFLPSGKCIVSCCSRVQQTALLGQTKIANIPCKFTIPSARVEGVVKGISRHDVEWERFKAEMKEKSIQVMRLNDKFGKPSTAVKLTFHLDELPLEVSIAGQPFHVHPFVPPTRRCTKCQKLGHTLRYCNAEIHICGRCSGRGHGDKTCRQTPRCVNCHQDHPSNDPKCGEREAWRRASVIKSINYMTFAQALTQAKSEIKREREGDHGVSGGRGERRECTPPPLQLPPRVPLAKNKQNKAYSEAVKGDERPKAAPKEQEKPIEPKLVAPGQGMVVQAVVHQLLPSTPPPERKRDRRNNKREKILLVEDDEIEVLGEERGPQVKQRVDKERYLWAMPNKEQGGEKVHGQSEDPPVPNCARKPLPELSQEKANPSPGEAYAKKIEGRAKAMIPTEQEFGYDVLLALRDIREGQVGSIDTFLKLIFKPATPPPRTQYLEILLVMSGILPRPSEDYQQLPLFEGDPGLVIPPLKHNG